MLKHPGSWKPWLIAGFLIVIAFNWLNEIWDLPHLLLSALATPVNWRESLIETFFALFMLVLCWKLIERYESRWIETTQKLEALATIDELSGVLNRREFLERAEHEFRRAKRFGRALSFAMLDLDDFKNINDHFGHLAGDRVIRELGSAIMQHTREQDVSGRIGGDEFVIAIVESTHENAEELGRRIQRSWQQAEIYDEEKGPIKVTFSLGITSVLPADESLIDCIRRADQALYTAKSSGGNQIVIAE